MSDAFETYKTFLAVKRHFETESYDYSRYYGKVTVNFEKFMQRKDRFTFFKLAKKGDVEDRVVSAYIDRDRVWVTDVLDVDAEKAYLDRKKRLESLLYNFKKEIEAIDASFKDLIRSKNGEYPLLFKMYQKREITIESLILFDECTNVFDVWHSKLKDDFVWESAYFKLKKYRTFVPKHDSTKVFEIMMEKFKNS